MVQVDCTIMELSHPAHHDWRRLQVHEQMAERQKKDPMQKALIFSKRAAAKVIEDSGGWGLLSSEHLEIGLSSPNLVGWETSGYLNGNASPFL